MTNILIFLGHKFSCNLASADGLWWGPMKPLQFYASFTGVHGGAVF